MRIAVLGAGAWGTALAQHAARAHPVKLWARDPAQARSIAAQRRNLRYLPDCALAAAIDVEHDLDRVLGWLAEGAPGQSLLVLAVPLSGLRQVLSTLRAAPTPLPAALWLCKGLERETGLLPHQVVSEVLPQLASGALSGPSFAQEVAAGLPVALVAASPHAAVSRSAVAAFHHGPARIYQSDDLVGVEVGGALKNVMAVAAGICDGLALGHNARAALITRGLAEIARFGVATGARLETFTGLAGLGDLVLTCTGDLSRNRRVGLGLAAGQPLAQVLAELGHVAEGVACAPVVRARADALDVELPIVAAVCDVLAARVSAREAVGTLLARDPKREH